MPDRINARLAHHLGNLATDDRHFGVRRGLRLRCEQPHNAQLANGLAAAVIDLDAHIIHVLAAMHPRPHIGLGHQQRFVRGNEGGVLWRGFNKSRATAQHLDLTVGQNAQPALGDRRQRLVIDAVVAHPQKSEVVLDQPVEKPQGFIGQTRLLFAQRADRLAQALQHGLPVPHCLAHLGHGGVDLAHHGVQITDGIAVNMQHAERPPTGFTNHRVRKQPHRAACGAQCGQRAVDDEGHVGRYDIKHQRFARLGRRGHAQLAARTAIGFQMRIGLAQDRFEPIRSLSRQILGIGRQNGRTQEFGEPRVFACQGCRTLQQGRTVRLYQIHLRLLSSPCQFRDHMRLCLPSLLPISAHKDAQMTRRQN